MAGAGGYKEKLEIIKAVQNYARRLNVKYFGKTKNLIFIFLSLNLFHLTKLGKHLSGFFMPTLTLLR